MKSFKAGNRHRAVSNCEWQMGKEEEKGKEEEEEGRGSLPVAQNAHDKDGRRRTLDGRADGRTSGRRDAKGG